MLANRLARSLAARNIHYGWVMVGLLFTYGIFSSAAMSIPGVLLGPISQDLGWSIGELSGPLGLRVTLFGLIAPFAGGLILLYGPRRMLSISAVLLLAGYGLAIAMTEKWQLWLGLGVILGIAPGLTALVMGTTISTRWFTQRRGLVTGILGASFATGQLIFLTPAVWLAEAYGWRWALVPLVAMIAVMACIFVLLARDRPSDIGLAPYGEDAVLPPPARPEGNVFSVSFEALRRGSTSRCFWVLAFTFFVSACPASVSRRISSRCAPTTASRRSPPPPCWRRSGCST